MFHFGGRKLIALGNLGVYFILHLLKMPFAKKQGGMKDFLSHYKKDGIVPLTTPDKKLLHRLSGCINCGFCDMVCPALLRLPRERFPGPSFVATTFSRSFSHLKFAQLDLTICSECGECERACPNAVPIKEGVLFIKEKIAEQIKLAG